MNESDEIYLRNTYDGGAEYDCLSEVITLRAELRKTKDALAESRDRHIRSLETIGQELVETARARNEARQQLAQSEKVAEKLRSSLAAIMGAIDAGLLVRDISRDDEPGWAMQQLPLVMALAGAAKLLEETKDAI